MEWHVMEWSGTEWDGMGRNGTEWDGMEWDGMGWDGMGWDGMGWNGMEWDGMGWNGVGWDGMGWDGMGWDGMEWNGSAAVRGGGWSRYLSLPLPLPLPLPLSLREETWLVRVGSCGGDGSAVSTPVYTRDSRPLTAALAPRADAPPPPPPPRCLSGLRLFEAGHRVRLHVCSAAHPRWMRNLGYGFDGRLEVM